MNLPTGFRAAWFLALFVAAQGAARALVRLNDGTDQIYVTGTYTIGWSSNINASAPIAGSTASSSDTLSTWTAEIEYQRLAGVITVNASAMLTATRYADNPSYDSNNPTLSLEFDKGTGRETGTLGFSATRTSQSDTAAGIHDVSWDYSTNLTLKYPVIERYYFTGSLDASLLDYVDKGGQPLSNLTTYGASLGLFYVLSDERDLFATYRYRLENSSSNTYTTDNAYMVGVSGRVFWEINGDLSVGYQIRDPHGYATSTTVDANGNSLDPDNVAAQSSYDDFTGSAGLQWAYNRRLSFKLDGSKDFATTSIDATTDTTSFTLQSVYAQNAHLSLTGGVGCGWVQFFGPDGLLPITVTNPKAANPPTAAEPATLDIASTTERRDTYYTWNVGGTYMYNSHFSATVTYNYFQNWSNLSSASFSNRGYSLELTSRW